MEKISHRFKILLKALPSTILGLSEFSSHPWLLIFDHLFLPSHSRIKRAPFYVKRYFKMYQSTDRWIVDFNQFKIILTDLQCTPKTLHSLLLMYYDIVYADIVNYPNPAIVEEGPYGYKKVITKEDDLIIDAGANMGMFSFHTWKKLRGKCKIFSFEPIPEVAKIIKDSRILNNIDENSLRIYTSALGDSRKSLQFHFSFEEIGGSSKTGGGNLITVNQNTIDRFAKEENLTRVDFIKMDIEGMEDEALRGARETIKKWKPRLAICTYHKPGDRELLTETIKNIRQDYIFYYTSHKLFAY